MGVIIPFGKYKGSEVATIKDTDPQYLDWLSLQPDLSAKWPEIAAAISDRGGDESPTHNALQAQFLDDTICRRLIEKVLDMKTRIVVHDSWPPTEEAERIAANMSVNEWSNISQSGGYGPPKVPVGVWDNGVNIPFTRRFEQDFDVVLSPDLVTYYREVEVRIECKPTIGDDYPAVLRQIEQQTKRRNARFTKRTYGDEHYTGPKYATALIYSTLKSEVVSVRDIKRIFAESDVWVIPIETIGGIVPAKPLPQPVYVPDDFLTDPL